MPKLFERLKSNTNDIERAELLASGKCFVCREVGHLARHCPKGNTVHSSDSNRPRVSNFNIKLEPLNEKGSDKLEVLYNLQASAMSVYSCDVPLNVPDWEFQDQYDPHVVQLKNCFAPQGP